jgi:UMF1 family MFS transporter
VSSQASFDTRTLRWSLFDVASSTFFAIVPPFFGLYFLAVVAPAYPGSVAYWGLLVAAAIVLAGILAPVVGAFADRSGRWLMVLAAATVVCVGATLLLPLAGRGYALVACAGFLVAQVAYTLATNVYDSLVVDVAPAGRRGFASGLGWGLGLCGGLVAILMALAVLRGSPASAQMETLGRLFMYAAVLFGVLAVPALLALRGLRSTRVAEWRSSERPLAGSVDAVIATLQDWRRHMRTLRVLASFFLINDVLVTLQFFITILLSTRFSLTVEGLLQLSLVFHGIAIPSTIGAGVLADRWNGRRMLTSMSAVLGVAVLLLALSTRPWVPLAAVALLALVFGSMQAVFRSLYASLVEEDRAAEFFGFNSFAGRLSAAIGPLLFGSAAALLGSQSLALFILLVPLAAGVVLLALPDGNDDSGARGEPDRKRITIDVEGVVPRVAAKRD